MALRGIKPEYVEKRLKALFYGEEGSGKTTAAIQFPKPYLIDCERGAEHAQYTEKLLVSGGAVFRTADFSELLNEVKALLTEKHEYKTLIIDPLTIIYDDLVRSAEIKLSQKGEDGTAFGRHYAEANKYMKHLLNLLTRLDMNVVITAHAKKEYGDKMSVIGQTYDCYKKLGYLFDIVLEIQKRGKERHAVIKKSRIKSLEEMETFLFSYDELANRYGRDILEKQADAEKLASEEQVAELRSLIDLLHISEDIYQKWLDKCQSSTFDEMPEQAIQKCIDMLKNKIK